MLFSKKGQSLSMQTIVVAALALIVLAIITLIFIGQINKTNSELNNCVQNGGTCTPGHYQTCEGALADSRWTPGLAYSNGRIKTGFKCYTFTGEVDTASFCCQFA